METSHLIYDTMRRQLAACGKLWLWLRPREEQEREKERERRRERERKRERYSRATQQLAATGGLH